MLTTDLPLREARPPADLPSDLAELGAAAGGLSSTAPTSPSAMSAQSLVMSSSAVGGEASVTLTLADTQGLLSGGLDTVTLNIASQVGAHLSCHHALWRLSWGDLNTLLTDFFSK